MMKKQILLLAALAVLAGCAEQMEPVEGLGGKLTARIGDAETRVSFDESSGKFSWTAGDQIDVHTTAGYKTAELDVNGCFSLERGSVRDGYAIYPTGIVSGTSDLTLQLPASYDVESEGMVDFYPSPMVALNDPAADDIWFYHAGAVARLVFTELPAETRTIVVTLDQRITGTFAVADPGTDHPVIATDGTATGTSVTFNLAGAPVVPFALNVPIPTGTYNSISVSIQDASNAEIDSKVSNKVRKFPRARGRKIVFDGDEVTEYTLILEGPTSAISQYGGDGVVTVKSYKSDSSGDTWVDLSKVEFSEDGGTTWTEEMPAWLRNTGITPSSDGISADYTMNAFINRGVSSKVWSGPVTYDESVVTDLSKQDIYGEAINQSTANCYVVSAPGWFKFPAVYGNALKDGQTNEASYISTSPEPDALGHFLRHDGNAIVSPWIKDNGITIADACLLWEDALGLVSNISFANDYVTFFVEPETIIQGNAVIAVRDATGNIVWSWHIWLMDNPSQKLKTKTVNTSFTYIIPGSEGGEVPVISPVNPVEMMDMNLGWCEAEEILSVGRSVKIRVTQSVSGKTEVCTLTQEENDAFTSYGNCTLYQWGRKDPMLPARGDGFMEGDTFVYNGVSYSCDVLASKSQFYENDAYMWQVADNSDGATIAMSIQHPNIIYHHDGTIKRDTWIRPSDDGLIHAADLWNSASVYSDHDSYRLGLPDSPVVKTVYDPCPIGFSVPNKYAFNGFLEMYLDGNNTKFKKHAANESSAESDHGFNLYCDYYGTYSTAMAETTFFPHCGTRSEGFIVSPITVFATAAPYRSDSAVPDETWMDQGLCMLISNIFDPTYSLDLPISISYDASAAAVIRPIREYEPENSNKIDLTVNAGGYQDGGNPFQQ